MDIVIHNLKWRAITNKLCDFLSEAQASMYISTGDSADGIDIIINSNCFQINFESDEREEIVVRLIVKGKRIAYTFDSADVDSICLM